MSGFISDNSFIDIRRYRLKKGKKIPQIKSRGKKLKHVIVPNLIASLLCSAFGFVFNTDGGGDCL